MKTEYRCPKCGTKDVDYNCDIGWQCFNCTELEYPLEGVKTLILEAHV